MIYNKSKYRNLLAILSSIGVFLNFSYAKDFSYITANTHLSNFTKSTSNYTEVTLPINQNKKQILSFNIEEKAIEKAKEFAPAKVDEIEVEHINDEMGKLTIIKVYLDFSKELEDEEFIRASSIATKATNSENILIKYL